MTLKQDFMAATDNLFEAFSDVSIDIVYLQQERQDYDPETGVVSSRTNEFPTNAFFVKSKEADNPNNKNTIVIRVRTADLPEELTASDKVEIDDVVYSVISTNENDFVVELTL